MRTSTGNSTAVLRCNTANSSLTIGVKNENMNKRIGSTQFEIESLQFQHSTWQNRWQPLKKVQTKV